MNNKRLIEIDVRRCFKALKTHLSWIFMSAILFLAIGIVFALATEEKQDMYKASSSVYCITEGGDYSATYDSTKLMMTYAEIGKSQTVLERANQIMGNRYESTQDILDLVDIDYDESAVIESALLRVNAVGPDKDEVVEVANAVAEAFVIEMSNITENGDARILDQGGITDGIFASGIFREECTVISKNSAPDWESDNAAMCVAGEDQIIVIWCNLFKVITSMIKKNVKIFVRSDRKGVGQVL